jgi:hypothetical protein
MNDSSINKKTKMQIGGAFVLNNKRNDNLTWKLGLYVNNDLFGVLPGNLTYEHKINEHFYYGANFRAITNSYGNTNGYWRIDENQLGIYLDTYFNKNFVLNIEAGHSLLRKIRTGAKDVFKFDANVNDNFYAKASFAYRVRFKRDSK